MGQNKTMYSKKIHIGTEWGSLWEVEDNRKPNPFLQGVIQRLNLCYSRIYQKENWKKNRQFPLQQEKIQPLRHLAQLSIWRAD